MDKQQAKNLIKNTFENSFDKSSFTGFIKNLLNRVDDVPFIYQGNYIPDAYKQYIKTLERIGKFSDGENNIDILVITLQKETSLERARTTQRNFVAWYLNGSRGGKMKDAALVAYVSPDGTDWRFSLVKMDYKFEQTTTGKMKVKEEFTPARRWSFLVGTNEKSHTAQSRLINILANDEQTPTLEEIEKAFDIETVTKEFFFKYRELFLRTKEEMDLVVKKNLKIKADFEAKGVDTVNFAKKLLGQIIFLYFLQKKGWFGVGRDDDWGTGSKHFLRELFEKKHCNYNNFFNDILEPLFYEALRTGEDRKHEDYYYSRFNCKIPFLNGGLFDPIGNYDWVRTDIHLPDNLFSNPNKTKEGDVDDGILDIFDRYNFTVKEDEPLEKEVAIDPELLGKAYEKFNAIRSDNYEEFKNALKSGKTGEENKFNKKFGVYYTPREIVHYMCQQSLINYLVTELDGKVCKEAIEFLVLEGEKYTEYLKTAKQKNKNKPGYKGYYVENQYFNELKKYAVEIDDYLSNVNVCDPAVGSGAFPVGMMSEIVKAKMFFLETECLEKTYTDNKGELKQRSTYNYKRNCIEHSLYGVDIDPGAVEIAKLRMWLSLVVDEDDITNIKPLPNLDYRIMQGNSLISEFMGINFDNDKVNKNGGLFKYENDELIEEFQKKKDEFLNASNVSKKSELKEEVEGLLIKIFETKLKTQKADYFNRLKDIENKYSIITNEKQRNELIKQDKEKLYKESGFDLESVEKQLKEFTSGRKIKPFFLWKLYFSEVFHNKGGFDVVIANPPYGADIDDMIKIYRKEYIEVVKNYADIYKMFFYKGLSLCNPSGVETYITPNTFLAQPRYKDLRKYLIEYNILQVINLGEEVFVGVTVPVCITITKREPSNNVYAFADLMNNNKFVGNLSRISFQNVLIDTIKSFKDLSLLQIIALSAEDVHFDEVLIIKDAGIQYHRSGIGLKNKGGNDLYERLFCKSPKVFKRTKPVWYGRLIDTYYKKSSSDEYFNLDYRSILRHNESVSFSNEAFNVKTKILWRQTASYLRATLDYDGVWFRNTIQCCWIKEKYIDQFDIRYVLSLINSSYMRYLYNTLVQESGRVFPQVKITHVKKLPLRILPQRDQKSFISIVDRILSITKYEDYLQSPQKQAKVKALEAEIDHLVYKLYNLTPEEIKIVEGRNENAD